MDFETAQKLSQDRLAQEGENIGDLFKLARSWTSEKLIGSREWEEILEVARDLPITMGAFPCGFEIPLHSGLPEADFGVSLTSGTRTGDYFVERSKATTSDISPYYGVIANLFASMEQPDSTLRDIVGRKVMLEFDVGSGKNTNQELPGNFLRPGQGPIIGSQGQTKDVIKVADSLVSCVGWQLKPETEKLLEHIYLSQPKETRMDSFGVFPSRSRDIRLAVMGFESPKELVSYLETIKWPGNIATVEAVTSRFQERASITLNVVNLDVGESQLGPELGLSAMFTQRYTNERGYWLEDPSIWVPFLEALDHEEIVVKDKLEALYDWLLKPKILYGKAGRLILLRGIHHIKLVISEGELAKVKAYVFMVCTCID